MAHIILTNKNFKDLHQDFWDRKFCDLCDGNNNCSNCLLTVATSSCYVPPLLLDDKVDVLLIGERPADCLPPSNFPNYTFVQHVIDFYIYYMKPSSTKANQIIISNILNTLHKNNQTWVYTDYLKNFNAQKSYGYYYSNCIVFLILQILLLKPKIVITFGSDVLNLLKVILNKPYINGVTFEHANCYKVCIDLNKILSNPSLNLSFKKSSIDLLNKYKSKFNLPDKHCFCWIISLFPGGRSNFKSIDDEYGVKLLKTIENCIKNKNECLLNIEE